MSTTGKSPKPGRVTEAPASPKNFGKSQSQKQMSREISDKYATIQSVVAREIFDSRGNPTVEVDVETGAGTFRASVPAGQPSRQTWAYEAQELRDNDHSRLRGHGCLEAIAKVNNVIAPELRGMQATEQQKIDRLICDKLDGSKNDWGCNKSKLGANAVLAVSIAICRAGAAAKGITLYEHIARLEPRDEKSTDKFCLPVPAFTVMNGGRLVGNGNKLACQSVSVLPVGASSFAQAMQIGAEVYHSFKAVLEARYSQTKFPRPCNVWDEGGVGAPFNSDEEALDLLMEAIKKSGHEAKIKLSVDVAASNMFCKTDGKYDWSFKTRGTPASMRKTPKQMIALYEQWLTKYPFVSIEDPFDHDDFADYELLTQQVGSKIQIVGADLLCTNPKRVQQAVKEKACNAIIIQPTQVGTVSETLESAKHALSAGWSVVVAHRSGETEDSFIADLAVGVGARQINAGAPCRSERIAKYNQLLRIEQELAANVSYAGSQYPEGKFGLIEDNRHKEMTY